MKIQKILITVFCVIVLTAACSPAPVEQGSTTADAAVTPAAPPTNTPVKNTPTAVNAAIGALTQKLNISANQVKIDSVEAVDWPDGCLGAQKPDEMCSQIVTPGYRVVLEAGGKTYEYHANQDGSEVRAAGTGNQNNTPAASLSPAEQAAVQTLAKQIGSAPEKVRVVRSVHMEWPDGCLGVMLPGRMCTQVITPGFLVILEANGKQYEFHTDETGASVLSAAAQLPKTIDKILVWQQTENNVCSQVEIGPQSVAFGVCGATLKEGALSGGRTDELTYLSKTYSSFSTDTKAGSVEFNGMGQKGPTAAEERSIAEWARLVFMEAQGGRGGAAWGLAFSWHREGGIAGFCDDLGVYLTGWAVPSSCKAGQSGQLAQYRLTPGELDKMYAWVDQLASFDYEHKDAAVADAMLVRLSLMGTGAQQATPAQKEEIVGFAGLIYANAVNK